MAQQLNPVLATMASHTELSVPAPVAFLVIQLPANTPGKLVDDNPSIWSPATYVGSPDGVPGSHLHTSTAQTVVAIWGVK